MRIHLATWPPEKQIEQTLGQSTAQKMANSMRIHLAERDPQHHAWPKRGADKENLKLRILLSYWYYKETDLDALFAKYFTPPYPDVFADSGGFSADSQGVQITCAEYTAWVKRWQHLFTTYANLDVIGDQGGTWKNQQTIEDMGLNPLPVFTVGAAYEHLEFLVERYPYIALGGLVPHLKFTNRIMPYLIKCFKLASGKSVFHGFGVTSWTVLKSLPWYSVDSSSWGAGFRYGRVPVFNWNKGKFENLELGNMRAWVTHAAVVRSLGFDPRDFGDRARNDRAKICAISAVSYMLAEKWLRQRHGEIHVPQRLPSEDVGLRLHLADANPARFGEIGEGAGLRLHLSDTSNGINFGDAEAGLKVHIADARPFSGGDLASAERGLKSYLVATTPSQQTEWRSRSATQGGLNLYLAEHSLDRGG